MPPQSARRSPRAKRASAESRGGKSELRRAVRRVTPGQGNLKDSGTENIPPASRRLTCGVARLSKGMPRHSFQVPGFTVSGMLKQPAAVNPGTWRVNRRDASKGEKVR